MIIKPLSLIKGEGRVRVSYNDWRGQMVGWIEVFRDQKVNAFYENYWFVINPNFT